MFTYENNTSNTTNEMIQNNYIEYINYIVNRANNNYAISYDGNSTYKFNLENIVYEDDSVIPNSEDILDKVEDLHEDIEFILKKNTNIILNDDEEVAVVEEEEDEEDEEEEEDDYHNDNHDD